MKTKDMMRLAILVLVLMGVVTGQASTLLARLHASRSSYERFWGDDGWRPKERIWVPIKADEMTQGLFLMNPVDEKKEMDSLLKSAFDQTDSRGDDLMGESVSQSEKETGLELKDAGSAGVKRSAYGLGDCALVTNGLFGGAIRLAGGKSAIKLPNYSLRNEFEVDAWFKPEKLGGTLMNLPVGGGGPCVLTLTPEGTVAMTWGGQSLGVSERRMTPGTFTHVSFVFRKRRIGNDRMNWYPHDCLMSMDGFPQIWLGGEQVQKISGLGQPLIVGNNPAFNAPFVGLVDELRVSSISRDFCQYDTADCDPLARREIVKDLPVMRGRDELILDAALDGTNCVDGLFKAVPLPSKSNVKYVAARRGEGVVVSPEQGIRFRADEPVSALQGALEFWFMPWDWDNNRPRGYEGAQVNLNYQAPVFRLVVKPVAQSNSQEFASLVIDQTSETKGTLIPYFLDPLLPGGWHHVVVTWQGSNLKLYVDGQGDQSHESYILKAAPGLNLDKCQIVALDFGGFACYNAKGETVIDEVKLYKHRLTALEVSNAYQRFLANGKIQPLPPVDFKVAMNHPLKTMSAAINLLMPERHQVVSYDLDIIKTSDSNRVIATRTDVKLEDGSGVVGLTHPGVGYGSYLFKYAFKDAGGKVVKTLELPHAYPQPAWVDNTLGVHDGEVMPPWTPMDYKDGVMTCWGREMTIGPAGWPVKIVSQGKVMMPSGPEIRLVTDQGEIKLEPQGAQPKLVKQQPGAIETEGVAKGGGWTMTTSIRTEFDGFMKLQTRFEGPADAEVKELRISYPLQFADAQMFGFYTGEAWFRASHDFRLLPKGEGVVFASNKTDRQHPKEWYGKVSFLPYVTIGDDWRSFCWFSENDRNWTQSWTNPAVTISRGNGLTKLNLNIINSSKRVKAPLTYTFGLQATPIRPLAPNVRSVQNGFAFSRVCGFNGWYLQAPFEGLFSFRLSPKDLDWSYPERTAKQYRSWANMGTNEPVIIYMDRTWQKAPEDALEYNQDWRGWGDGTRYTKPVRDGYAWYINEWIRRGIMSGIYIDDGWIDPTKALWHLDPKDNLAYSKGTGECEWGFEFFDYREMLKRIRWLYLDNNVKPYIVAHVTQTPYYPVFGFVDIMLEGEDRYLGAEGEGRDFITSWGLPRLRYANSQKWGVPVQWMPILNEKLVRSKLPMARWDFQQNRSYVANLLLHDIGMPGGIGDKSRAEAGAVGCYANGAGFIGYWEPGNPLIPQEPNLYASVYQLPEHLALVLANAGPTEKVVNFTLDPAKVKALLGTDQFTITDVDSATIPLVDVDLATLKSGVKMTMMDKALESGVNGDDSALGVQADKMLKQMETVEKKQADPDGFFEYHNFRYENGILRLRIQRNDYRLLKVTPKIQ